MSKQKDSYTVTGDAPEEFGAAGSTLRLTKEQAELPIAKGYVTAEAEKVEEPASPPVVEKAGKKTDGAGA